MADPKITGPLPPLDWDLPDPPDTSPELGFHDDHVGAHLKSEEAARQRHLQERGDVDRPRDILTRHTKVEESAAFRPAQQDDELARRSRELGNEPNPGAAATQKRPPLGEGSESLARLEARLHSLMQEIHTLSGEINSALPKAGADRRLHLENRLAKMELQAKHQLQMLLSGGVGLTWMADPRLTFKRLFDRIGRWPSRVRPGHRPDSDDDFDAFFAWIFEPPAAPENAQEELATW